MNYVVSVYSYGGSVKHYDFSNFKKARAFAYQEFRSLRSRCDYGDYGQMHVVVSRTYWSDDFGLVCTVARYYA